MKYVHYDKETYIIKGFYDKEIHGDNIPEPNVEISDELWMKILETNSNYINPETLEFKYVDTTDIKDYKDNAIRQLKRITKDLITNGFKSKALGKIHYYQSQEHDQINLTTLLLSDTDGYVKCSKDKTSWKMILHTVDQIKQLVKDNKQHKENILIKYEEYKDKVSNSDSKEEINNYVNEFKSIEV